MVVVLREYGHANSIRLERGQGLGRQPSDSGAREGNIGYSGCVSGRTAYGCMAIGLLVGPFVTITMYSYPP